MKIKISSLSEGKHFYELTSLPSEIDLPEEFIENVEVSVKLEKTKEHIFIQSIISAVKICTCDRCLIEYKNVLHPNYFMFYINDIAHKETYDPDTVTVISKDTDEIDLSVDVREYILLSVPMKNLCSEECKGLCPKCGKDLNYETCECNIEEIDPRWEKLKNLKLN
ncbi:MAG: DUF177 domain-containing protein [Ignavibacteria bacterium]|nr:DUF177 domain-containing protein [Ignavibacteria bacterium]